jgi:hypothetical protein
LGALPVIFSDEFEIRALSGKEAFISNIAGKLQSITDADERLSEQMLEALLAGGFIMVVVDGFSEFSRQGRMRVQELFGEFTPGIVIITARAVKDEFSLPFEECSPERISGNRISSFTDRYLDKIGVRREIDDPEFFVICANITDMMRRQQMTVLFVKLYLDQILEIKERETVSRDIMPGKADLVRKYILKNWRKQADTAVEFDTLWGVLKRIAMVSVLDELVSAPIEIPSVDRILKEGGLNISAGDLVPATGVSEIVEPSGTSVRFTLDPVAEYLSALGVIDDVLVGRLDPIVGRKVASAVREADERQGRWHENGFMVAMKESIEELREQEVELVREWLAREEEVAGT